MAVNMAKLKVFVGKFVGDLGAAVHSGRVVIGEKLGLYKALAEGHPELSRARTTGMDVARCMVHTATQSSRKAVRPAGGRDASYMSSAGE